MGPHVISHVLQRSSAGEEPVNRLTSREREVLELMAQGRSNAAIAAQLVLTEWAITKHTVDIFTKLGLSPSDDDNRRVLAVLAYLDRGRRALCRIRGCRQRTDRPGRRPPSAGSRATPQPHVRVMLVRWAISPVAPRVGWSGLCRRVLGDTDVVRARMGRSARGGGRAGCHADQRHSGR